MEKTVEELVAELEALANKNKELISEKRKLQAKVTELDIDTYNKALEENEQLKETLSKLDKNSKTEIEKLSKTLTDKDSKLKQILVTDGLRDAFVKNGADKELLDAVLALHQNKVQLGDDYSTNIDGKDLNTFAKEWLSGDGKRFMEFVPTSGGSSNGSGNGTIVPKEVTVDASKHKDASSFMSEAFNSLKK